MKNEDFFLFLFTGKYLTNSTARDKISACRLVERKLNTELDEAAQNDEKLRELLSGIESLKERGVIKGNRYRTAVLDYVYFFRKTYGCHTEDVISLSAAKPGDKYYHMRSSNA